MNYVVLLLLVPGLFGCLLLVQLIGQFALGADMRVSILEASVVAFVLFVSAALTLWLNKLPTRRPAHPRKNSALPGSR
jgi:hypothetical protein